MIVSENNLAEASTFEALLEDSLKYLLEDSKDKHDYYLTRTGQKFEDDVFNIMESVALGTSFENSVKQIGGQKFPDIIAKQYYGVEVKTTTQKHWKSTGNSIFENTRVEDVSRIYMFFARLSDPIDFRVRRYEECLPEIKVTHSPRYSIDMDTPVGETIFDKIGMSYDDLRTQENPIEPIKSYYKQFLKEGDNVWWMDSENIDYAPSNFIVRLWSNLKRSEQQEIMIEAMAFFPEIFTKRSKKYNRIPMWLLNRHGILHPNLRDSFTASGMINFEFDYAKTVRIPAIFKRLIDNKLEIKTFLSQANSDELRKEWGVEAGNNPLETWINLIYDYSKPLLEGTGFDVRKLFI